MTSLAPAPSVRHTTSTVAVYRDRFLKPSETFVRDHLQYLRRYRSVAVTRERIDNGLIPRGQPLVEVRRSEGWKRRWHDRLAIVGRYPSITDALRRAGADLVHAHFGPGGWLVHRAVHELGLPLIVTFHGFDVTVDGRVQAGRSRVDRQYVRGRRKLFDSCAAILTVSHYLAGRLVQQGAPPSRVRVIPCGVDTKAFSGGPVPERGPIVFVGRLVEKKGCADLLHAVAELDDPPSVVVIGDGPLRARLERLAARLRIKVTFEGTQPTTVVRTTLEAARVVVIPSKTAADGDQEGLPVVSLEAAAAGRPIVASRHSGLAESVIDGLTGLLFTEGDLNGLVGALRHLLGSPHEAARLGAAGRVRAQERFDLRRTVGEVEQVYDQVLGRNGRSTVAPPLRPSARGTPR